jgi:hypothetical protein
MFYNYIHLKPSGEIFYIGKGKDKRAWFFYDRNSHWQRTVDKYGAPKVKIIADWEQEEKAMIFEKFLIATAKCFGFELTNKTKGGDGTSGLKRPDLSEYNRTRTSPLLGKSGAFSKTSKPLCVEFTNGDVVFTEVGGEEFARQIGMPTGSMSFCVSTGRGIIKYGVKKAWRP